MQDKKNKTPITLYVIAIYFSFTQLYGLFDVYLHKDAFENPFDLYFFYMVGLAVFCIIASIGALRLKTWGRVCLIAFCIIGVCQSLINYTASFFVEMSDETVMSNSVYYLSTTIGGLIDLVVLWYLFRSHTRQIFEVANRLEPIDSW